VVAVLTADQIRTFAAMGWIVVPGLVAPDVLSGVDNEVDRLITEAPPPDAHVGHHFYWQTSDESPALFSPLPGGRSILAAADELVGKGGVDVAFDQAQVALNIAFWPHRPGRPHIDGYAHGQRSPGTFTLLAALLLTDQLVEDGGNLWVWPGTHLSHAAFFAARGPRAFAEAGGYPDIELPAPTQVRGRRGDVLFAHYLLGHNTGGNERDCTRRAVYWRLRAPEHVARWEDCLVDPWFEYPGVRRLLEGRSIPGQRS
jgi:hypothetical protein